MALSFLKELKDTINPYLHNKQHITSMRTYYTYMLTNFKKNVLYVGVTNNLPVRLIEHWAGHSAYSFTRRYNIHYLVWFEETGYVLNAIAKEKALKRLSREKKDEIITASNPGWKFLNEEMIGNWPPTIAQLAWIRSHRKR